MEFTIICAVCGIESPPTPIEDDVLDIAKDSGWQVNGNNEDGLDLCTKCQ